MATTATDTTTLLQHAAYAITVAGNHGPALLDALQAVRDFYDAARDAGINPDTMAADYAAGHTMATTTSRSDQLITAYLDMEDARRAALRSHAGQDDAHFEDTPADGVYDDAFEAFATLCAQMDLGPDEGIAAARDQITAWGEQR